MLIKKLRKDLGINQEELAARLHIGTRQLSRIETGEKDLDIWQMMTILEALGHPTEDFWLLYLDSVEYENYKEYRRIKRLLREKRYTEVREHLPSFEQSALVKHPFIQQFISQARIEADIDMPPEQAIEELYKVIKMTRSDFDESKIPDYRLSYNEICIIACIVTKLSALGRFEHAISLTKAIIESRERIRVSEEDKAHLLPVLLFNVSTMLGREEKFKESLKYCTDALEAAREYNNFRLVPGILYNMASCYRILGEEEHIYKTHLMRAYHCAYAIGDNRIAKIIKNDAECSFGIYDL